MEFWSTNFLVWYISYIAIPALGFFFTIWQEKNRQSSEKVWMFIAIAIIVFVYYWNYVNESNKLDCVLSHYWWEELYSKEDIISKCLKD